MQSLNKSQIWIALWWKKFDKFSFLYLLFFFVLYYLAASVWVTGKPVSLIESVLDRITSYDFTRTYSGIDLMGVYIWLYILPFILSVFLFNKKAIFFINFIIPIALTFKIYSTYVSLEDSIPLKTYIQSYIKVIYHQEIYLFLSVTIVYFLFSLLNLFIFKLKKIRP